MKAKRHIRNSIQLNKALVIHTNPHKHCSMCLVDTKVLEQLCLCRLNVLVCKALGAIHNRQKGKKEFLKIHTLPSLVEGKTIDMTSKNFCTTDLKPVE